MDTMSLKNSWQNETEKRSISVIKFLKNLSGDTSRYDSILELHFSGSNLQVMEKIMKGEGKIVEVQVFYEDGKETQIHVVFDSEGQGQNIDVYIKGKALDDYLNEEASLIEET